MSTPEVQPEVRETPCRRSSCCRRSTCAGVVSSACARATSSARPPTATIHGRSRRLRGRRGDVDPRRGPGRREGGGAQAAGARRVHRDGRRRPSSCRARGRPAHPGGRRRRPSGPASPASRSARPPFGIRPSPPGSWSATDPTASSGPSTSVTAWPWARAGVPARAGLPAARPSRCSRVPGSTTFEVTAIDRDGLLEGPDLDLLRSLVALGRGRIIASGGIASIDDVLAVQRRRLRRRDRGTGALRGPRIELPRSSIDGAPALGRASRQDRSIACRRAAPAEGADQCPSPCSFLWASTIFSARCAGTSS